MRLLLPLLLSTALHAETIDLPTTLRLAGANAIDVKLAEEKLAEARADVQQRTLAFLPVLNVGVGYTNVQGAIQDIVGTVLVVDKQQYTAGVGMSVDLSLGDALYQRLAAKQKSLAAEKNVESERLARQVDAASAYFDLVYAAAIVGVTQEAVSISSDYGKQVANAVQAGVAFKGDALRVDVQTKRNELDLERAKGALKQASVALAEKLRLDPTVTLTPADGEPRTIQLVDASANVKPLIEKALANRPELARELAAISARRAERDAIVKGSWVPTLTAQVFAGGLDGGIGSDMRGLDDTQSYFVGLKWKIGAGGLFDKGRRLAAESRIRQAELNEAKAKESITAQVVAAAEECRVLAKQVTAGRAAVKAAEENNKLTHERQEFAVGIVLETVLAEQELTRARLDYLQTVTRHNAAQYLLKQALGTTSAASGK
ncbi:MAG: TolC family protein [Verrucomicrobiaceae bacterium]|nr:TolC family protein [Verrucomicrobiaceae bacterium]